MPSTAFTSGTIINAAWLNEVNTETFLSPAARLARLGLSEPEGATLIGYESDDGNGVALTVQDELRRRVNVIAHGADPTGADDSAQAFRDAVAAANGGLVIVPSGTYKILSAVDITTSLVIRGESAFLTTGTSHNTVFNITSSNVTVENLKFTGAGNTTYDTDGKLVTISGVDNGPATAPTYIARVRIRDCFFYSAGRAGIFAKYVDHIMVERCTFNQIGYGMVELISCTRALVSQSYFKTVSPGTGGNGYGVYFSRTNDADTVRYPQSKYGTVRDCYFQEIDWEAIDCHGIDGLTIQGNTIYDCGDSNCAIALIYGDDETSTPIIPNTNVRIIGNYISTSTNRAIAMSVMDSVSIVHRNIVIEGNTIESIGRPSSAAGLYGGISVASVVNCVVANNTLTSVSPYGILVLGLTADNVTITGNAFERVYSTSNTEPSAILVSRGVAATGAVMISGNTLIDKTVAPPDAYQNVYGVSVPAGDGGNVRLGPNHFVAATTQYSASLAKFGSAALAIVNHGTASVTTSTGSYQATLDVTLPNVYSANTAYNIEATIATRNGGNQVSVVEATRISTSEIRIRVYTCSGANYAANSTIDVYWRTIGF